MHYDYIVTLDPEYQPSTKRFIGNGKTQVLVGVECDQDVKEQLTLAIEHIRDAEAFVKIVVPCGESMCRCV